MVSFLAIDLCTTIIIKAEFISISVKNLENVNYAHYANKVTLVLKK